MAPYDEHHHAGRPERVRATAVQLAKRHLPPGAIDQLQRGRAVGRHWATRARIAWLQSREQLRRGGPRILCWPDLPEPKATLHRFAALHGWRLHNDPDEPHDAVVLWKDATWRADDDVSAALIARGGVVNGACVDISKRRVNKAFEAAFGHPLGVDPVSHVGPAVQKSDENARHDGVIVDCPIEAPLPGMAYQRVVDNREDDGYIVWRVPVVGDRVPYVWRNVKTFDHRFESGTYACRETELVETHQVLCDEETRSVIRFARELGMDYGELDMLRDRGTGRIYAVDANATPHGPPVQATYGYCARVAHERLAHAFASEFLPRSSHDRPGRLGTLLLDMR